MRFVSLFRQWYHYERQCITAVIMNLQKQLSTLTHYQTTNFTLFQNERFADDNLKFEENGRKLFKTGRKTVEKGEIARYEQYLLFPQCLQKACFPGRQKVSLCGNGLISEKKKRKVLEPLKAWIFTHVERYFQNGHTNVKENTGLTFR